MAESFFGTLKAELILPSRMAHSSACGTGHFEFIAGWYNEHRRHSTLGYFSPPKSNGALRSLTSRPNEPLHQNGASPSPNCRLTTDTVATGPKTSTGGGPRHSTAIGLGELPQFFALS